MGVNKVVFGTNTIMDISDSTVDKSKLLSGTSAYDKSGNMIQGNIETYNGSYDDSGISTGGSTSGTDSGSSSQTLTKTFTMCTNIGNNVFEYNINGTPVFMYTAPDTGSLSTSGGTDESFLMLAGTPTDLKIQTYDVTSGKTISLQFYDRAATVIIDGNKMRISSPVSLANKTLYYWYLK